MIAMKCQTESITKQPNKLSGKPVRKWTNRLPNQINIRGKRFQRSRQTISRSMQANSNLCWKNKSKKEMPCRTSEIHIVYPWINIETKRIETTQKPHPNKTKQNGIISNQYFGIATQNHGVLMSQSIEEFVACHCSVLFCSVLCASQTARKSI